jgi:selenide,water dikinase
VGFDTADDAAVYRVSKDLAVVETVDFFPPVVDDPFVFGEIAAANALSDIWAMGARPIFALNLVAFPKALPLEMLGEILAGGQKKAREAGIPILGGHSIDDPEPKYGMAVTGLVHPRKVLTNAGAKEGDLLILTKPLGSGIGTTAIKRNAASPALVQRLVNWMRTLNKAAGEVFASGKVEVHALTDVTGFGLLGHLGEMMAGARKRARLFLEQIPTIEGVPELARQGVVPGGTRNNLEHVSSFVRFPEGLPEDVKLVLADAQTNGGLLASVPARQARKAMDLLGRAGVHGHVIGEVLRGRAGTVEIVA